MKKLNWFIKLAAIFLSLSVLFYAIHYWIYGEFMGFILKYVIAQLGFLFINVYVVTIIINQLMNNRAKKERLEKLNMVIGAFFADVGVELLKTMTFFCSGDLSWKKHLLISEKWEEATFNEASEFIKSQEIKLDSQKGSLVMLRFLLDNKREHLLRLLENPSILEHEYFTKLLWTVFHVSEELFYRKDLSDLPANDYKHLSSDIERAYKVLVLQWLDYMHHLKTKYPYMFSLAVRNNPFDEEANISIQ